MAELIQIAEPKGKVGFSISSYGFGPFFLAAWIYAILPLLLWILYLVGWFNPDIPLQTWRAHEMLFGFVAAAISGFLLTAIPNWTNTPPLTGAGLKRFSYFWQSGRIAFWALLFIGRQLVGYLLFLDLLLPVAQGICINCIFITTGNKRKFIFIGIMITLIASALHALRFSLWASLRTFGNSLVWGMILTTALWISAFGCYLWVTYQYLPAPALIERWVNFLAG